MKKRLAFFVILMMFLFLIPFEMTADERPPYDIVIIIDKSISMAESGNLEVVKKFITDTVIRENVKIGDFLIIMNFWGMAEVIDSFTIETEADRTRAQALVSAIRSTPRETNTDIGNAIDIGKYQIEALTCTSRPKVVLMVTDGYQEAPRFSKYYSPDHTFTNAFLDTATTIAKKGWKIHVIEIGGAKKFLAETARTSPSASPGTEGAAAPGGLKGPESGLKETTEQMGGLHRAVSEKPTTEELNQAAAGLTSRIDVMQAPTRLVVPASGIVDLSFKLKGMSLTAPVTVTVTDVRITSGTTFTERSVLAGGRTVQVTVPPDGEAEFKAQLHVPVTIPPGDYPTDVRFIFEGDGAFQPAVYGVDLHINSVIENNLGWFIALIITGIIVLALLVFLIIRFILSRGVKFRLIIDEQPLKKGKDVFTVGIGKWLYMNESYGRLSIAPKRSLRSIGRIYGVKKGLEFEPLREEQFPGLKQAKQNVLGQKIVVKTQEGATVHVSFSRL